MYLKLFILLILITIIIILTKSKNENFNISKDNISKDNITKLNNLVVDYNDKQSIKTFNNIQVINKFLINNVELKDVIINLKYPIGCYYIQYPENNNNFNSDRNNNINDKDGMLPYSKSPEALFGGKWEEKFVGESIFFRTGGVLSDDARVNGIQDYAMKNLEGSVKYIRDLSRNNINDIFIYEDEIKEPVDINGTTIPIDPTDRRFYLGNLYLGPPVQYMRDIIFNPSLQSPVSKFELRVKNRIIKVWKRIA